VAKRLRIADISPVLAGETKTSIALQQKPLSADRILTDLDLTSRDKGNGPAASPSPDRNSRNHRTPSPRRGYLAIALVSDEPQLFKAGESHAVIAKLFSFQRAMMRGCWQANRKKK